eukprot:1111984-Heterocapsa_arctica.AAC.1
MHEGVLPRSRGCAVSEDERLEEGLHGILICAVDLAMAMNASGELVARGLVLHVREARCRPA